MEEYKIKLGDKEFSGESINDLAVKIAKSDVSYTYFEIIDKAQNLYHSMASLNKEMSNEDLERIAELARTCFFKDETECGEHRFYDSIIELINNGHNLDELEDMSTWDLIKLCDDEAHLRVY